MNLFNDTYTLNGLDNELYKALEKRDGYTYAVLLSTLFLFGSLALKIFYNSLRKLNRSIGSIQGDVKESKETAERRYFLNPVVDFSRPLSMGSFIENSQDTMKGSEESSPENEPISIATVHQTPKTSDQIIKMTKTETPPNSNILQIQAIRPCTLAIPEKDIEIDV